MFLQEVNLKYGFATDEPEVLEDGTICKVTMVKALAHRSIVFDETEIRLGSDVHKSGTRAKTHTNPRLNRGGARSTRSHGHVTAGMATTADGELLPPLIIFSSSAEKEKNMAVRDEWLVTFRKPQGKYGHTSYVDRLPYIAVQKSGSADIRLFMEMTR